MESEDGADFTDWRDWENFCRVAQAGSFTLAGELAGVPKSSISASVVRLERQLGVRCWSARHGGSALPKWDKLVLQGSAIVGGIARHRG